VKTILNTILLLILTFLVSCNNEIKDSDDDNKGTSNSFQIKFNLSNANDTIKAVSGLLASNEHDNIAFDFDITGETASKIFDHIQAGSWVLTINAYSTVEKNAADLRYTGSESFSIVAGEETNININLNPTTGVLDITVAWGSAASLGIEVDQTSSHVNLDHYYYTLTRSGFTSVSGKINKSGTLSKVSKEIHDLKDGVWAVAIEARSSDDQVIQSVSGNFELQNGFILDLDVSHVGLEMIISSSFNTQSGDANKVYMADEAFRKYLILAKNFTDLREPYVLKSEVLAIEALSLQFAKEMRNYYGEYALERSKKGDLLLAYFDASVLKEFTNLKELHLDGWVLNNLTLLNHPALNFFSLKNVAANYVDLTGATNLKVVTLNNIETYWVDLAQSSSLVDVVVRTDNFDDKARSAVVAIGSIYLSESLINSNFVQNSNYRGFITQAMHDTISNKVVSDEMTRKVFLHNGLRILKGYNFSSSEASSLTSLYYGERINPAYGNGNSSQAYLNYVPLSSTSFLMYVPNLKNLTLYGAMVTNIDLSNSPDLLQLYIGEANYLTSLNLSVTDTLRDLDLIGNAMLQSINFGIQKYNISNFTIRYNHSLQVLDLRNSRSLGYLYANNNYSLTTVNLDSLDQLSYLELYSCNINQITMANNTSLYGVSFYNNNLTTLDLTSIQVANSLNLQNNNLTGNIDISSIGNFSFAYFQENPNLDTIFTSFTQTGTIYKPDSTIVYIIDTPQ
jgi:hypothetical protein